jgi:hypothetical protein
MCRRKRLHVVSAGRDIEKRCRPTTSGHAEAPEFHVPGRNAVCGECGCEVTHVSEIYLRAPPTAVENNGKWMPSGTTWDAQVSELRCISAIGNPSVSWRRDSGLNVRGHCVATELGN